jgi:AraC-like DNA-binding protein
MASAEDTSVGRGSRGDAVSELILQSGDPDEITEALAPIAPGSRFEALSRSGFIANLRAWRFPRTGLLTIDVVEGRAILPGNRSYAALTVASAGTCLARHDPRTLAIKGENAHFLGPDDPTEFRPGRRSRVLGANLDTSLFTAYMGDSVAARRGSDVGRAPLLSPSAERSSLRRFLGWLFQELANPDSSVHLPRVATELESVLAAILADACSADDPFPALPGDDRLRRAEEYLAARLRESVSLAEVAAAAGVSVRTLSRGFRERHGVGPIGFLHRRRLEAARGDLLATAPGYATVTEVAHRYGFAHTGRFAIAYRRAFGESPSTTLRRSLRYSRHTPRSTD